MIKALGLETKSTKDRPFSDPLTQKLQRGHKQGVEIPVLHMYIQNEQLKQLLTTLVSRSA